MMLIKTLKNEPILVLGGIVMVLLAGAYYKPFYNNYIWTWPFYSLFFLYLVWGALGVIGIVIKPVAANQTLYKLITPVDPTPAKLKDLVKNKDFWVVLAVLLIVPVVALALTRCGEADWAVFIIFPYLCGMLSVCFRKVKILHIFIILVGLFTLLQAIYNRYPLNYDSMIFVWYYISIMLVMHSLSHILEKIQPFEFINILVLCVIHFIFYVYFLELIMRDKGIPGLDYRATTIIYLIMVLANVFIDIKLRRRA